MDEPKSIAGLLPLRRPTCCMRCGGEMEPDSIYCSPCDAEVRNALAEMDAYRNRFETAKLLEGLHQEELISATLAQLTERGITTWHGLRNEWNGRAIDIVLAWSPGRHGLWISGGPGSGKTSLLALLARKLQREKQRVCLVELQPLLRRLVETPYAEREAMLRRLARIDALLLDDVLSAEMRRVELDALHDLLSDRLQARKGVVCTSNYDRTTGARLALTWWAKNDEAAAERLLSRLIATTGTEVDCTYPGDWRTGVFDDLLAQRMRIAKRVG